jgi:hypothetical protein
MDCLLPILGIILVSAVLAHLLFRYLMGPNTEEQLKEEEQLTKDAAEWEERFRQDHQLAVQRIGAEQKRKRALREEKYKNEIREIAIRIAAARGRATEVTVTLDIEQAIKIYELYKKADVPTWSPPNS